MQNHEKLASFAKSGLRQKQIGERLGVSQPGISNRVRRAKLFLKGCYKEAWQAEASERFRVPRAGEGPAEPDGDDVRAAARGGHSEEGDFKIHEWIAWASWTFCPACGRHRADGKLVARWWKRGQAAVAVRCSGGCDRNPWTVTSCIRPRCAATVPSAVAWKP